MDHTLALVKEGYLQYQVGEKAPLLSLTTKGHDAVVQEKIVVKCISTKKISSKPCILSTGDCFLPGPQDLSKLPTEEREYCIPEMDILEEILCNNELGKLQL